MSSSAGAGSLWAMTLLRTKLSTHRTRHVSLSPFHREFRKRPASVVGRYCLLIVVYAECRVLMGCEEAGV